MTESFIRRVLKRSTSSESRALNEYMKDYASSLLQLLRVIGGFPIEALCMHFKTASL